MAFVFALLLCLSACAKTYKIGDVGPAGGIVFYDKGLKTEGWRYLEVSPVEAVFTAPWGFYGVVADGTRTGIGEGKKNTDIIVSMTDNEGKAIAGYRCSQLEIKEYEDWFLPSKDELDLIYRNLHQQNLGAFMDVWYWSSSVGEYAEDTTWSQDFSDGILSTNDTGGNNRGSELRVRASRAF